MLKISVNVSKLYKICLVDIRYSLISLLAYLLL